MSTAHHRTDWEVYAVSACWVAMWVVLAICFTILAIYGTMFGVATMKAHWP
jgi:hypothetical protein